MVAREDLVGEVPADPVVLVDPAGLEDLADFRVDPEDQEDAEVEQAVAAVLPAVEHLTPRKSLK